MRSGEAISLLFRLHTDGSQSVREVRRTRAEYVKEVRAMEVAGQRALTILSAPVRGRLGFVGALGINSARQALRSFAETEIAAVTEAQKRAAASGNQLGTAMTATAAATHLATARAVKHAAAVTDQAKAFKFGKESAEIFERAIWRANRALTTSPADRQDSDLRRTLDFLRVNRQLAASNPAAGLAQFAQAYNRIENATDRAALAQEVFGRRWKDVAVQLELGRERMLAAEKATTGLSKGLSGVGASAKGAGVILGAFIATAAAAVVAGAVMVKLGDAAAKADEPVAKLADTLGLSAENMSVLDVAARRTGREITEIRESINIFNRQLGEAAAGNLPHVSDLLRQLGIDAKAASKDNDAALIQFINAYNRLHNPTQKAALLQKLFSDESGKVGGILREIGPDFEAYKRQLRETGLLMTAEAAKNAKEYQRNLRELGIQYEALRNTLGRSFVSGLSEELGNIIGLMQTLRRVSPLDPAFSSVWSTFAAAAKDRASQGADSEGQEIELGRQQKIREASTKAYLDTLQAAADYQKQIEQNTTAEIERQVALRQKSLHAATAERIAAAKRLAETEVTVIRARMAEEEQAELKEGETEANRRARIEALRVEERAIADRFRNEELKAWADYRVRMREMEDQAQADAIEAAATRARAEIETLEAAIAKDESLREAHTRRIAIIEQSITQIQIDEIKRRLAAAGQDVELRAKLHGDLTKVEAEATRQREETKRRIEEAALQTRLTALRRSRLGEGKLSAEDAGRVAALRDEASTGAKPVAEAELAITNVTLSAIDRRIDALKEEVKARKQYAQDVSELTAQISELEQERTNAQEEGNRRYREGLREDAERTRESASRLVPIEVSLTASRIAARMAALSRIRHISGREIEVIKERYQIEVDSATLAKDEAITAINEREHAELLYWRKSIANNIAFEEKAFEIQKHFNELRNLEEKRSQAEIDEINRQRNRELELQNPLSTRSLFGDTLTDELTQTGSVLSALGATAVEVFRQMGDAAGNMTTMVTGAIQGVVQGLGGMIEAWVLTGTVGSNALRKLAAATLASFAAQSLVKAAFLVAEGFGYAAKASAAAAAGNIPSALLYSAAKVQAWKAAALYGLVGGAAAVAGRAIAGDAFSQGGTNSGGASDPQRDTSREDRFTRDSREQNFFRRVEATMRETRDALRENTQAVSRINAVPADSILGMTSADAFNDARVRAFNSDPNRIQEKELKPALA